MVGKRIVAGVLLFLAACGLEPDIVLPLRAPSPGPAIPPPRPGRLAMMSAGAGVREPKKAPEDPPPTPYERITFLRYERPRSGLQGADLDRLFELMMERRRATYRDWFSSTCGSRTPWIAMMTRDVRLEACLFTDLHPEYAQRRALEILQDPEAHYGDVYFALMLLRSDLWPISPELEEELVTLTRHHWEPIVDDALWILGQSSRAKVHRPLLRKLAAEGVEVAFELLSDESEPETNEFLEKLSQSRPDPEGFLRDVPRWATETLRRLQILQAPDWKQQILAILKRDVTPEVADEEAWWAETVARRRMPEAVLARYRRYIEGIRKQLGPSFRNPNAAHYHRYSSFVDQCLRGGWIEGVDYNYDFYLLGYAQQGGELTLWEAKRLERFGFVGDRETRLQEILEHGFR